MGRTEVPTEGRPATRRHHARASTGSGAAEKQGRLEIFYSWEKMLFFISIFVGNGEREFVSRLQMHHLQRTEEVQFS
jgi:hypothetical protein